MELHVDKVRLHYFRRRPNFGDLLSAKLVEELSGRTVEWQPQERANLWAAGSLFCRGNRKLYGLVRKADIGQATVHIWGCGFHDPEMPKGTLHRYYDLKVHAVRGAWTEAALRKCGFLGFGECSVLGDPGLLYPDLCPDWRTIEKSCELAVVPHYYDQEAGRKLVEFLNQQGVAARFVDVSALDPLRVIREIAAARKVLSSSLHGLIVADAMGIPNRRLIFSGFDHDARRQFALSHFMFGDYYSAFGVAAPKALLSEEVELSPRGVLARISECMPAATVERIKAELRKSFAEYVDGLSNSDVRQRADELPAPEVRVPALSVVLPFGNDERKICDWLDGAVRQTYGDFELLCVNCGSTDATADYVRYFAAVDRRIRLCEKAAGSSDQAAEIGLAGAKGTYSILVTGTELLDQRRFESGVGRHIGGDDAADLRVLVVGNANPATAWNPFVPNIVEALRRQKVHVDDGAVGLWENPFRYDVVNFEWPEVVANWSSKTITSDWLERLTARLRQLRAMGVVLTYTRHNVNPHRGDAELEALYRIIENEVDAVFHMGETSKRQLQATRAGESPVRDYVIPHHINPALCGSVSVSEARRRLGLAVSGHVVAALGAFRDDAERKLVKHAMAGLGPSGEITLLAPQLDDSGGRVDDEAFKLMLAASDVVFLQRTDALNSGNLPLGFLYGKTVVGPDCGNVGEILRATGNPVFDARNPDSATQALRTGLAFSQGTKGAENRDYALRNWSPAVVAEKMKSAYLELKRGKRDFCADILSRVRPLNTRLEPGAIPVVFIADDNYALPAGVAISSLAHNRNHDVAYHIYVLAQGIAEENAAKIKSLNQGGFAVEIIDISDLGDWKAFGIRGFHVSTAAMAKFLLPVLFPALDKLLYLDDDILIREDLSELWLTDIREQYLAAVASPRSYHMHDLTVSERLGCSWNTYFNSGMMLLNLDRIRRDDGSRRLLEYRVHGHNDFMDQDALNAVLGGRVRYLPLKFNAVFSSASGLSVRQLNRLFPGSEIAQPSDVFERSLVFHYSAVFKPWAFEGVPYGDAWVEAFKASPFVDARLCRRAVPGGTYLDCGNRPGAASLGGRPVLVSFVWILHDEWATVRKALRQKLNDPDFERCEIVCVDCGTMDGLHYAIRDGAAGDPRVKMIELDGADERQAVEAGVRVAVGERIVICRNPLDVGLTPENVRIARLIQDQLVRPKMTECALAKTPSAGREDSSARIQAELRAKIAELRDAVAGLRSDRDRLKAEHERDKVKIGELRGAVVGLRETRDRLKAELAEARNRREA